jgi:hypothetical protein
MDSAFILIIEDYKQATRHGVRWSVTLDEFMCPKNFVESDYAT